jgi:hypothetical protein
LRTRTKAIVSEGRRDRLRSDLTTYLKLGDKIAIGAHRPRNRGITRPNVVIPQPSDIHGFSISLPRPVGEKRPILRHKPRKCAVSLVDVTLTIA